jgi:hypothetical protein
MPGQIRPSAVQATRKQKGVKPTEVKSGPAAGQISWPATGPELR